MPQPELSPQETRLASFCRVFAVVYFVAGLGFAVAPSLTFRIATLGRVAADVGPQAQFWNILAVAMMTAIGTACLVTAARPRERRHAILPVVVANLTTSVLALAHLKALGLAAGAIIATDLPLFVITLLVYRAAAPGVRSAPAREAAPPAAETPAPVQLGVTKVKQAN
jgi:hypothetical protein